MAERGPLLGEWAEHKTKDGVTYFTRVVDGFEDLTLESSATGWIALLTNGLERVFPTREQAERCAYADPIAYVEEWRDHCQVVIDALKVASGEREG